MILPRGWESRFIGITVLRPRPAPLDGLFMTCVWPKLTIEYAALGDVVPSVLCIMPSFQLCSTGEQKMTTCPQKD